MKLRDLPIYVINLDRSPDRRDRMAKRLSVLGLSPTFVTGVDGKTLDVSSIPNYDRAGRLARVGKDIRPNEFGCYMSHVSAIRRIVDEGHEAGVIMEDDLFIDDPFPELLERTLQARAHFDMVRFATGAKSPKHRVLMQLDNTHNLVRFNNTVSGLLCYMLTADGARKALKFCERILYPVDVALNRSWDNGINQLGVFPFPVRHDWDTPSTIGDARFDAPPKEPGLRGAWLGLYRFWNRQSDSIAKRTHYALNASSDSRTARALSTHIELETSGDTTTA